jgi:hypothetical protein
MLLVACAAVTEVSPGVVVAVALEPPASPGLQADGSRVVFSDRGDEVRVTRAYLVSSSLELVPCARTAAGGWRRWVVGRAEAHEHSSPTRLGAAVVEALVGAADGRPLGELAPPPGHYCHAIFTARAADADADGLPAEPPMIGRTLYLEGTYRRDGAVQPFVVSSAAPLSVTADLDADLSAAGRLTLVVRKPADHWFDGVDFQQPPEVIAARVVENVRRSLRVEPR